MRLFIFLILLGTLFLSITCEKDKTPLSVHKTDTTQPPPPPDTLAPEIHLTLPHPAGVNEAWLQLQLLEVHDTLYPVTAVIERNNTVLKSIQLHNPDTIIADDRLPVSTTFSYRAWLQGDSAFTDTSETVTVTTLDSTEHGGYTWQRFELGEGISDALYDVAIINENNIWAVGELSALDSLGEMQNYNALHWNGSEWKYIEFTNVPVNSIFALNSNDIWAGTSGPYHYDGNDWSPFTEGTGFGGYIKKIWGNNGHNVFFVGTNGKIAHYNGTAWQQMESGTDVNLIDVWGSPDGSQVWACGTDSDNYRSILLHYNGIQWETVYEIDNHKENLNGNLTSIWFSDCWEKAFICGSYGVFRQSPYSNTDAYHQLTRQVMPQYPYRIRGTAANNVIVVGSRSMIMHYNGSSWHLYNEIYQPQLTDALYSVDMQDNVIVAVGNTRTLPDKALIIIGRK